jgi:hypothetical protein
VGWSRHPLHTCNLQPSLARKKKWNYWAVTSNDLFFSATAADVERLQLGGAYLFDRRTRRHIDKAVVRAPGTITIPETPAGDMIIDHPDMRVSLTDEGSGTRIRVEAGDFAGAPLEADILVERPAGHETLNVVIPWSRDRFQFTSKQNTLRASGTIALGRERIRIKRDEAFAAHDYGRGVWKNRTAWNWGASSSVLPDGRLLGFNLGGTWTDGTGMTENGICLDGRLSKIGEDLAFVYDEANFMKPWGIRCKSRRIDLRFVPFHERVSKAKAGVLFSEVHQLFGHYTGAVVPDSGEKIAVTQAFGWIEEHKARW